MAKELDKKVAERGSETIRKCSQSSEQLKRDLLSSSTRFLLSRTPNKQPPGTNTRGLFFFAARCKLLRVYCSMLPSVFMNRSNAFLAALYWGDPVPNLREARTRSRSPSKSGSSTQECWVNSESCWRSSTTSCLREEFSAFNRSFSSLKPLSFPRRQTCFPPESPMRSVVPLASLQALDVPLVLLDAPLVPVTL